MDTPLDSTLASKPNPEDMDWIEKLNKNMRDHFQAVEYYVHGLESLSLYLQKIMNTETTINCSMDSTQETHCEDLHSMKKSSACHHWEDLLAIPSTSTSNDSDMTLIAMVNENLCLNSQEVQYLMDEFRKLDVTLPILIIKLEIIGKRLQMHLDGMFCVAKRLVNKTMSPDRNKLFVLKCEIDKTRRYLSEKTIDDFLKQLKNVLSKLSNSLEKRSSDEKYLYVMIENVIKKLQLAASSKKCSVDECESIDGLVDLILMLLMKRQTELKNLSKLSNNLEKHSSDAKHVYVILENLINTLQLGASSETCSVDECEVNGALVNLMLLLFIKGQTE